MLTPNGVGFCLYLLRVGFLGPRVWVRRGSRFFCGFWLPEHWRMRKPKLMKLYQTLETQLKKELNFVTDNGELKKWVVINKAQNFDSELLELLLDNDELKDKFFVKVKDVLVFNQNLFVQFL